MRRRSFTLARRVPHTGTYSRCFSLNRTPQNEEKLKDKHVSSGIVATTIKKFKPPSALAVKLALRSALRSTIDVILNPRATMKTIKDVIDHYWVGSKLLWSEIKITKQILMRLLEGHGMTRRERMQLIRTTTDIFRLVPFSIFIIVPFMEVLLPVALRFFPNMLPSTFQDSFKKEEAMKKELQMRLAVAGFMQETLQQMVMKKKKGGRSGEGEDVDASGAKEVLDFLDKAKQGDAISNDTVIKIAKLFKDELTLANISRPQLVSMCIYMGLQPYGADNFLRFQLRTKFRSIKEDDRRILWEGIDSLNTFELREACRDRGMRSLGLTQFKYRKQLLNWLDLSTRKEVPISLLIMSRAFMLSSPIDDPEKVLQSSMSSLDSDTINEVVLAAASSGEEQSIDFQKRKLESLQFQQDLIVEEREHAKEAKAHPVAAVNPEAPPHDAGEQTLSGSTPAPATAPSPAGASLQIQEAEVERGERTTSSALKKDKDTASADFGTESLHRESASSSSAAVHEEEIHSKIEITMGEIIALSDLARGSSVQREKAELAIMLAHLESVYPDSIPSARLKMRVRTPTSGEGETKVNRSLTPELEAQVRGSLDVAKKLAPPVEQAEPPSVESVSDSSADAAEEAVDVSVSRMKLAVNSMLEKLEKKIRKTEEEVGDKLNLLDKDGDGLISTDELRETIEKIFRKTDTAEQLMLILDSDKDGKVTMAEMLEYIRKRREELEVEDVAVKRNSPPAANN